MRTSKITLADIAKLAGVSTSTVSRALTDSPQISAVVKQRIRELAEAHNYQIHVGARNLRLRKNHVIAVVLPIEADDSEMLANPFVLEFIGAVQVALHQYDYNLLLLQQKRIDPMFWRSNVADGFIQLGHGSAPELLNALPPDIPLVVWGPQFSDRRYCTVGIDNWKLAQQAVNHLISLGRRRIGILCGGFGKDDTESYLRYRGYREALTLADIPFSPALVAFTEYGSVSGYQAANQLIRQVYDLDAIFAAHSDIVALAAIEALRQSGRYVPEDVAVVGFDNVGFGMHFGLPLTTISQEIKTTGARVLVETLMKQIAGETTPSVIIEGKLIVRQSCGAAHTHAHS